VATAKQLAPEWYQVHCVDALVKVQSGSVAGAQEAFVGAIEREPNSASFRETGRRYPSDVWGWVSLV
jgi:hypothetical protein